MDIVEITIWRYVHLLQTYPLVRNCTLIKIKYDKYQINTDINKIHISWYSTSTDETIACMKHKQNGHANVRWSACSCQSLIVTCVTPMVLKSICGLRSMALKLNRDKRKKNRMMKNLPQLSLFIFGCCFWR